MLVKKFDQRGEGGQGPSAALKGGPSRWHSRMPDSRHDFGRIGAPLFKTPWDRRSIDIEPTQANRLTFGL